MPNPTLTILGPLTLLTLSIPLSLLAMITATFAFTALAFRVTLVYIELGYGILRSIIAPESSPFGDLEEIYKAQQTEMAEKQMRQRQAARRRIASGAAGYESGAPAAARLGRRSSASPTMGTQKPTRTTSAATMPSYVPTVLENRDYEGVGGWRLPMPSTSAEEAAEDDAIWMGMNSRLELPTPGAGVLASSLGLASGATTPQPRRHRRTPTSGSQRSIHSRTGSRSPEQLRMSPVQSRKGSPPARQGADDAEPARVPAEEGAHEEYFPLTSSSSDSQAPIMSPEEVAAENRMLRRRQSFGASSTGSAGSTGSTGPGLVLQGMSNTEG